MKAEQSLVITSLTIMMLAFVSGCANIKIGEAGVRNNKILHTIRATPLHAGLWAKIPYVHELQIYETRQQTYEMTRQPEEGDKPGKDDIEFKTRDGQSANIDMTIVYQIIEENLVTFHRELGTNYLKRIRDQARSVCRNELGKYTADEIYLGETRIKVQEDAKKILNEQLALARNGKSTQIIMIHDVLFKRFEFNKEYQDLIESVQQAEKQVERNEANAKAAEAKAKETEALADGDARAKRKLADADLYAKEKEAEGIRAIGEAEAAVKKSLAEAMGGGENIVRLEFAKNIPDKLQIWGIPTGSNSMSFMDLSGFFKQMIPMESPESEGGKKP